MKYLFIIITLLSFNVDAEFDLSTAKPVQNPDIIETWSCSKEVNSMEIVIAKVFKGRRTGSIDVAGIIHQTTYRVNGFNREWYFGPVVNGVYQFTFVVRPSGMGLYYDFVDSDRTKVSFLMRCKQ